MRSAYVLFLCVYLYLTCHNCIRQCTFKLLYFQIFFPSLLRCLKKKICLILTYLSLLTLPQLFRTHAKATFFYKSLDELATAKSDICSQCEKIIMYFSFWNLDSVQTLECGITTKQISSSGGLQVIIFFTFIVTASPHKFINTWE